MNKTYENINIKINNSVPHPLAIMFGNSNKSQESFLELFQNAAQARSSNSNLDSPKKESLKNILISKSPLLSSPSSSENSSAALKNFLMRGITSENSGSSEAFHPENDYYYVLFYLCHFYF